MADAGGGRGGVRGSTGQTFVASYSIYNKQQKIMYLFQSHWTYIQRVGSEVNIAKPVNVMQTQIFNGVISWTRNFIFLRRWESVVTVSGS